MFTALRRLEISRSLEEEEVVFFLDYSSAVQYTSTFYHGGMKVSAVTQEVSLTGS